MSEQWFLKIDGIKGDSLVKLHKDEIDVLSWSWGVSNNADGGQGGGGSGAGKPTFQDFAFVTAIGTASPALFYACAAGKHSAKAELVGVRGAAAGKAIEFLRYRLQDVVVTSVQHAGGTEAPALDQFTLRATKVEMSYTPQSPTGQAGKPIITWFDLETMKA